MRVALCADDAFSRCDVFFPLFLFLEASVRVQAVGLGRVFAVQTGNLASLPGIGLVSAGLCLALGGA